MRDVQKRPGRPPAGRVKVLLSLDPAHIAALREEAARRASAEGMLRPDASAVVRSVLDEWIAKRRARKEG